MRMADAKDIETCPAEEALPPDRPYWCWPKRPPIRRATDPSREGSEAAVRALEALSPAARDAVPALSYNPVVLLRHGA